MRDPSLPLLAAGLVAAALAGCGEAQPEPSPAAAPASAPSDEAAPAPTGEAAADQPAEGAAQQAASPPAAVVPGPEEGAEGPELGQRPDRIPAADELPRFQEGAVAVSLKLPRKMSGQVDFMARDAASPQGYRIVHAQRFTDSDTIQVNAPATWTDPLYVLVHEFPDGIPVYGPDVPKGVVRDPVTFQQDGATFEVLWGDGVAWMGELFRPGEGDPVPPPGEKGPPPG